MTTRNGNIARLPEAVRHELSCRLSEGDGVKAVLPSWPTIG
jgi:hypothetical protein